MNNANVSKNAERQLFVISGPAGISCLGFQNCFAHAQQLAQLLRRPDLMPVTADRGELTQYQQYLELIKLAGESNLGTYFDPGTPAQVRNILEQYRLSGEPLRIFLGDDATGRDWLEESDVYGRIGRSMGALKVPLLLDKNHGGGPAILTAHIVRMIDGRTKRELYRHPAYHQTQFTINSCSVSKYKAEVRANGEVQARFTTKAQAERWIAFMTGESMRA